MFIEKEYFPWERATLIVQEVGRMPATGGKSPFENLNPITTSERMIEAETTVTCTKNVTPASLVSSIVAVARSATTRNLAENRTQQLIRRDL